MSSKNFKLKVEEIIDLIPPMGSGVFMKVIVVGSFYPESVFQVIEVMSYVNEQAYNSQ